VSFSDSLHGLTGGGMTEPSLQGWVHLTTNGARTWSGRVLQTDLPVRSVLMVTPNVGYAAGGDFATGRGKIWKTADGGTTWTLELECAAEIRTLGAFRLNAAYVDVIAAGAFPDFRAGIWRSRVYAPDLSGAVLMADPDTLDFGAVPLGTMDTLEVQIRNIGQSADTILNIGSLFPFSVLYVDTGIHRIAPGGQLTLRVLFMPMSAGNFAGEVDVRGMHSGTLRIACFGRTPSAMTPPEGPLPAKTALSVWPNPGNASFVIRFELPRAGNVKVSIFDLAGRRVETLADGSLSAGIHEQIWNASGYASGSYFVRLDAGQGELTQPVMLLK
jgi:hypothetical protein